MLSEIEVESIRAAFVSGKLETQSVGPSGDVAWYPISDVVKHSTEHKKMLRVRVDTGAEVVVTEDHSLFTTGFQAVPSESLHPGQQVAVVLHSELGYSSVVCNSESIRQPHTYDLCVPGPENFVLANGIVAHNTYSIGGVSLDLEKSSKYESAKGNFEEEFSRQLEQAKLTVKIIRGLQQPRFGMGIRSSMGPFQSRGALSPRKFVGFLGLLPR